MVEPYAIKRLPHYERSYDTTLTALNEYGKAFVKLWNEEKKYSGKPEIILDGDIIIPVKKEEKMMPEREPHKITEIRIVIVEGDDEFIDEE